MNIQIFGKSKCFETQKAQRYFKERRVKFQAIDLVKYGMSGGEFDNVLRAVGGIDKLIDWDVKSSDVDLLKYLSDIVQKENRAFENQKLLKTPIVRNGKKATIGYCPAVWQTWE